MWKKLKKYLEHHSKETIAIAVIVFLVGAAISPTIGNIGTQLINDITNWVLGNHTDLVQVSSPDITVICSGADSSLNFSQMAIVTNKGVSYNLNNVKGYPIQYPDNRHMLPTSGTYVIPLMHDSMQNDTEYYVLVVTNKGNVTANNVFIKVDTNPSLIDDININNEMVKIYNGGNLSSFVTFKIDNLWPNTYQNIEFFSSTDITNVSIKAWADNQPKINEIYVFDYIRPNSIYYNNPKAELLNPEAFQTSDNTIILG